MDDPAVPSVALPDYVVGCLEFIDHPAGPAERDGEPSGDLADGTLSMLVDVDRGPHCLAGHWSRVAARSGSRPGGRPGLAGLVRRTAPDRVSRLEEFHHKP